MHACKGVAQKKSTEEETSQGHDNRDVLPQFLSEMRGRVEFSGTLIPTVRPARAICPPGKQRVLPRVCRPGHIGSLTSRFSASLSSLCFGFGWCSGLQPPTRTLLCKYPPFLSCTLCLPVRDPCKKLCPVFLFPYSVPLARSCHRHIAMAEPTYLATGAR